MQVGSKCCEQAHSIIFSSDGCPVRQENASCAMRVPFMAEQNFSEGSGWRLGASAKILAMPSVSISALLSALQQKEKKKTSCTFSGDFTEIQRTGGRRIQASFHRSVGLTGSGCFMQQ